MCNLASKGGENQAFFNGFSKEIKALKNAPCAGTSWSIPPPKTATFWLP
jgi:hypothetical protein